MLVLTRKVMESLRIGSDITVTVVRIGPNAVRLGIEAPKELNIVREELGSVHKIQADDSDISDLGRVLDPLEVADFYAEDQMIDNG